MRVRTEWAGPKFEVAVLDTSSDPKRPNIPALDFVESLNAGGTDEKPTARYKAMINRIQQHADHGPLTNKEHCRPIGDDMYELKTPLGDRVYWFYDNQTRKLTVLTNGSSKADFKRASQVATQLKGAWEQWQASHPTP